MNHRQLVIFTLILIFICSIGSSYIFNNDTSTKSQEMHTPQRIIDRQLSHPDESVFNPTIEEVPSKD
jgi:hypothetical protein